MTTTLEPQVPMAVRPSPYLRHLAGRTAEWTVIAVTVTAAMQAAQLLTGSTLLSAAAGVGAAVLVWCATQRQSWAVCAVAAMWFVVLARWVVTVHDLHALIIGAEGVVIGTAFVAGVLALSDVARRARKFRAR